MPVLIERLEDLIKIKFKSGLLAEAMILQSLSVHEELLVKIAEFKNWPGDERMLLVRIPSKQFDPSDLSEDHFEQGFSCRSGEITFDTFYDGDREGDICIEVFLLEKFYIGDDASHVILLPFEVPPDEEAVFIGTYYIDNDQQRREQTFQVSSGNYALYYETGLLRPFDELQKEDAELDPDDEEAMSEPTIWCRLSFVPQQDVEPATLRVEPGFSPLLLLGREK